MGREKRTDSFKRRRAVNFDQHRLQVQARKIVRDRRVAQTGTSDELGGERGIVAVQIAGVGCDGFDSRSTLSKHGQLLEALAADYAAVPSWMIGSDSSWITRTGSWWHGVDREHCSAAQCPQLAYQRGAG